MVVGRRIACFGLALVALGIGRTEPAWAQDPPPPARPATCAHCGRALTPPSSPQGGLSGWCAVCRHAAMAPRPYASAPGTLATPQGPVAPYGAIAGAPLPEGIAGSLEGAPAGMGAAPPGAAAPTAPGVGAGAGAGAAGPAAPAPSAGLGGGLGGAAGALVMFGDQAPIFRIPSPPAPPSPPTPPLAPRPVSGLVARKAGTAVPWVRGYKMAENISPVPQDRVFFNFNYFNNINYPLFGRIQSPINNVMIYTYQLGLEKTFLDGWGSIGIRDSINNFSARSPIPALGGTTTAMGDLNIFTKFILWQEWDQGPVPSGNFANFLAQPQANGGLISAGLSLGMPTGPSSFAGSPTSFSFRALQMQPFIGYYFRRGNLYFQGFESINVPLDPNDVTMLYNDVGLGYFIYRNEDPDAFLSAIAPTFEVHVNVPLNHTDVFNVRDLAGTATTVDFTYGINTLLGRRSLLSTAIVTPITGPRPFNYEVVAMLSIYFGRGARRPAGMAPPVIGQ
jgi:hypothetical protein